MKPAQHIDGKDRIVHIFLGRGDGHSQKILAVAPDHPEIEELTCELYAEGSKLFECTTNFKDPIVRLFEFEFSDLTPGARYNYLFRKGNEVLELGGGLGLESLYFTYWKEISRKSSMILMSCNGIHSFKDSSKKWKMWERLEEETKLSAEPPKLLVLGGDQYYQDEVEKKWLRKLSHTFFKKNYKDFKKDSLKNALSHMSNISYRKVMARTPSVAMLDDHDITDGAGGRLKHFKGEEFTDKWNNFASVQRELFKLLQASRNPSPIVKRDNSAFSFILDLGNSALVAADLRTEKNLKKRQLMESSSEEAFFSAIREVKSKNVMILLPVVPLRNSLKQEAILIPLSRGSMALSEVVPNVWGLKKIKSALKFFGGMYDDVTDALSSEFNKGFLARLFREMGEGNKRGVNYTLLSGDIHTGGSVELVVKTSDNFFPVPLLVSSPIGYQPMNFLVEAALREKKTIHFKHEDLVVDGVVNRFSQNRNYMQLRPGLFEEDSENSVLIYEEGVIGTRKVVIDGWKREGEAPPLIVQTVLGDSESDKHRDELPLEL